MRNRPAGCTLKPAFSRFHPHNVATPKIFKNCVEEGLASPKNTKAALPFTKVGLKSVESDRYRG